MPADSGGCETVLEFLIQRFSRIDPAIWQQRVAEGKVHWEDGTVITEQTPYVPHKKVCYYREVENESVVPFQEEIIYQDENILVACKPHFLPVSPVGKYVRQTLVSRLIERTGIETLAPLHRIDRETAGLVMLAVNPETRNHYHRLFREDGLIRKTYRAVAHIGDENRPEAGQNWKVENRMVQGDPWIRMTVVPGEINARSEMRCLEVYDKSALFELSPLTGKTHQLRVHMSGLGYPLVNDLFYPELQPEGSDDYDRPLQLLAHRLEFTDPVTGELRSFTSTRDLLKI